MLIVQHSCQVCEKRDRDMVYKAHGVKYCSGHGLTSLSGSPSPGVCTNAITFLRKKKIPQILKAANYGLAHILSRVCVIIMITRVLQTGGFVITAGAKTFFFFCAHFAGTK